VILTIPALQSSAAASERPPFAGLMGDFEAFDPPRAMPPIGFVDGDQQPVGIADFAGKIVVLNLWATWCAPCRWEMPALDRLQGELGGETFAVLPINIDTGDAGKPRAFLKSIETVNLALNTDPDMATFEAMKKRGLALGLPVTALIDRQGCLIGHMNGPAEWDSDDAKALIKAAIAAAGA